MPATGGGTSRWQQLAASLTDCFCLLTASAGDNPRAVLQDHGISVLITTGEIASTVDHLCGGGKKGKCRKG
jgi:nitrogen fixation protein NifB